MPLMRFGISFGRNVRALARDRQGVALIEFAYSLPIMALLAFSGLELVNYVTAHLRVTQVAISLADNASRAKQNVPEGKPVFRELDANESIRAAELQGGNLDLAEHGRVILSSLEVNEEGGQWIHWQRCGGAKNYRSRYGDEETGETGDDFEGMGTGERLVQSEDGFAIMYAEVYYEYQPLVLGTFISDQTIYKTAAMYVRDDRNLSARDDSGREVGIVNPEPKVPQQLCG